jgi:hypothetical protein
VCEKARGYYDETCMHLCDVKLSSVWMCVDVGVGVRAQVCMLC